MGEQGMETVVQAEEEESCDSFTIMERLMFLRVLLVEADDSSRMIISVLLRKCGYRVVAASDGLKAWETLKGRPQDIDLVLTEVELPSISGFSLLSLIIEHGPSKNIPVIMMSSQDSVSIVYKCMLKGAADFLVKSIRKNEIRNLWQHVWRRRYLRDYAHGEKPVQRKVETIDESNSVIKFSSDFLACPKESKECCEKGSDMGSSCTVPEMVAECAYACKTKDLSQPECSNISSTDGMKTLTHKECFCSNRRLLTYESEEDRSTRSGVQVALCNQNIHSTELFEEVHVRTLTQDEDVALEPHWECASSIHYETTNGKNDHLYSPIELIDLIGAFDKQTYNACTLDSLLKDVEIQCFSNENDRKRNSTSQLELSLMVSNSSGCETLQNDERRTLNHSSTSAFSWYGENTMRPPLPTLVCFCTEPKERGNISCKNVSSGKLTNAEAIPVRETIFTGKCHCYDAGGASLFYAQSGLQPQCSSNPITQQESASHLNSSHQSNPQMDDHRQACCLHDHSANKSNKKVMHELIERNLESEEHQRYISCATARSAASNLCNSTSDHINSSGCGSVCTESDGNVNPIAIGGATAESVNEKSLLISNGPREIDSQIGSSREVALTKYRLKRKDRCFEKKVRYQSRKRLAEQRPRLKGQFIRQRPS